MRSLAPLRHLKTILWNHMLTSKNPKKGAIRTILGVKLVQLEKLGRSLYHVRPMWCARAPGQGIFTGSACQMEEAIRLFAGKGAQDSG